MTGVLQEPRTPRRFTSDEYHRMGETGILQREHRVELIEGIVRNKSLGQPHRFSIKDYYRLAEAGILKPDERVELLRGRIFTMSPVGYRHSYAVQQLNEFFSQRARKRWLVRLQDPIRLPDGSEPQPDFALLQPDKEIYKLTHPLPEHIFLLIEVADSTLLTDRADKLSLYARGGIPEFWIVNLEDDCIEVHLEPAGDIYRRRVIARRGTPIAPAVFPDTTLDPADVLP